MIPDLFLYDDRLKFFLLSLFCALLFFSSAAQTITGSVSDEKGNSLAYSSVYIKGSTKGTTANSDGKFFIAVSRGTYTVVCAHVGYQKTEQQIKVDTGTITFHFILQEQTAELKEVVVKPNAEDPAYAIIRNAIRTRKEHLNEVKEWQALVYMKGMVRSYKVPKKILGIVLNPNRDIVDSTGKGILYFSESLTHFSRRLPRDFKEEVISAKVSGSSQDFGFNSPATMEVNLYENNIDLVGLNSRGFISPISNNALYFYRYKYLGTFYEDGREISKIQVMPKRKFEPCFAGGYINIMEGSWRIHSLNLLLTRESQMEIVDSVRIVQQLFPVNNTYWMPQQTNLSVDFTFMGFKAGANFTAVYSDYTFKSLSTSHFRGSVIKTIDTSANKKTVAYWDSIRPMPLTMEERHDYLKKDTLERRFKDPNYLDSIDKRSNRIGLAGLAVLGTNQIIRKKKLSIYYPSFINSVQYNTVEGWLFDFSPVINYWGDTNAFTITPHVRYGFSSKHFNAAATARFTIGRTYRKRWNISAGGGKYIYQINSEEPIGPLVNTVGTLFYKQNYLKIYENAFGRITGSHAFQNGISLMLSGSYEDRFPLENTDTTYTWVKRPDRHFTSNYPEELPPGYFVRHQALLTTIRLDWQPGQKFIQYPTRLVSLGSTMPRFTLEYKKAWAGILGSDANFSKWKVAVKDDINMKLAGILDYYVTAGSFFNNGNVQLPDWQHFNGNLTIIANTAKQYLNSFQLAPYYANSTKDNFFATANIEWHLNGLFTNKIPVIRRFNLGLVTGTNSFYVDESRNYEEIFVGIENLFKVLRIDFVWGYDGFNKKAKNGIIIGLSGVFTGQGVE